MGFLRVGATGGLRPYIDKAGPGVRWTVGLVVAHKSIAVFTVIALEEIGIPLPLPGDIFIMYAGHQIAHHRLGVIAGFLSIVLGSMVGASILYWLARRFGQPFVQKYGPYMHIKEARLAMVERWFVRHGPLVIVIGRQIPGLRMVISVFSGVFGVSYGVFLVSVTAAAAVWAGMFLLIGYHLDRQIGPYLTITPAHLVPSTVFITGSIAYGIILKRRAVRDEKKLAALAASKAPS
jgi:membrane protein DedA with SNARE-associated domain